MLVIVYVEKLITKHAENKKSDFTLGLGGSNKITIAGTKQLSDDLKACDTASTRAFVNMRPGDRQCAADEPLH